MNKFTKNILPVLLLLPVPSLAIWLCMIRFPNTTVGTTCFIISKLIIIGVPCLWYFIIDKQTTEIRKLTKGGIKEAVAWGLFSALVIIGAFFILQKYIPFSAFKEVGARTGLNKHSTYITAALSWIFINSLIEEIVWRGFIFSKLNSCMSTIPAILLSAFAFTIHHIVALNLYFEYFLIILTSLGVFIAGIIWTYLFDKFKSLSLCWLSHAIADLAIFCIGYYLFFR